MREIIKMRKHVGLMKQCGIAGAAFKYCPCAELVGVILVGVPYTVRSFIIYDNDVTLTLT